MKEPGTACTPGIRPAARWALIAWLVAASAAVFAAPHGTPYTPARDDTVLAQVPATTDPRVRRFERLARAHAARPDDPASAIALAKAYIDYGRSTGDARFLGRALIPIQPWLAADPVPVDILIVHATIAQSRHQFDAARRELADALARAPANAQAWLTLATVDMVQGDFEAARRDCVHTANSGGQYLAIVCNAALLSLTGRSAQAYRLLSVIEDQNTNVPIAMQAYVQGLLADAALRQGNIDTAEGHYRAALQLAPGDNFLLDHYADLLLDAGRPGDALERVAPYTASDTLFLRAVLARQALQQPGVEAAIQTMAERFAAMTERGSHVYRREQARFELRLRHAPTRALVLSEQNWQTQRAPEDVSIFLASALAAGRPEAAAPVIDFLDRTGMSDPHIDRLAARVRAARHNEAGQRPGDAS